MVQGVLLALATGLCWTMFGIILSFTAREKRDIVSFGILQNLLCFGICLVLFSRPRAFEMRDFFLLFALIAAGGGLNALGQYVTNRAMIRGHNGAVWAISQSSMVVPFVFSALFRGQPGTMSQWIGVVLILGGIVLPNIDRRKGGGRWVRAAFAAFGLFGLVQTLYTAPPQLPVADPAHLRPALAALGMTAGWSLIGLSTGQSFSWSRAMPKLAGGMALISVLSLKLFFIATDRLNAAGAGNIAVPLMVGGNVFFFALFSAFKLREKSSWRQKTVIVMLLLGLLGLAG